jgi:hypothetical protein
MGEGAGATLQRALFAGALFLDRGGVHHLLDEGQEGGDPADPGASLGVVKGEVRGAEPEHDDGEQMWVAVGALLRLEPADLCLACRRCTPVTRTGDTVP